jgi:hypothetical protein
VKIARNILVFLVAAAAILYIFDYVAAKLPGRQVYADVTIDQYYAVKEKGNKVEYMPGGSVVERCIYSVFPHFGYDPCWWVMRHTRREIDIGRKEPDASGRHARALARGQDGGVVDVLGG